MDDRKITLKVLIIITCFFISCNSSKKTTSKIESYPCDCSLLSAQYKDYWKNDSLGFNGFRILFVKTLFETCKLSRHKWKEVEPFLGKPELIIIDKDELKKRNVIVFLYKVKILDKRFKGFFDPGNKALNFEISEKDSAITKVFVSDGE